MKIDGGRGGEGRKPAGQREIIWKLKTKQNMNPGVWELKREVLCNSSQLMSSQPVLWPTREAKRLGDMEVGRTQTFSFGSKAQPHMCRMRSVRTEGGVWPRARAISLQRLFCSPQESSSLLLPAPPLVALRSPEPIWGTVTPHRLLAHLCSGMGGSGPLTHTGILQPIISCPSWLLSKAQHDRWMNFTRKLSNGPVFQECCC